MGKNPTYFIILYKLHSCSKYILVYYVIVFMLFKFALACLGLPGRPFKLPFENALRVRAKVYEYIVNRLSMFSN